MGTTRKTITVTDQQNAWIKSRIASGDYTNDSEFLRDLLRKDQERTEKIANMQRLVTEGFESGISELSVDEIWEQARAPIKA
ncbi:MAG: type II toxin-antitoxin system ParD family antitoxin [Robiginitomaculum sp.]|nr:type II toxin-antitoxin system ParD family antitoxin [Robiginitomaculum sp.]MCF6275592.1 type II toxin-antitoxin system ParD family antitoxin [Robiginitomaculum sp.]